MRKQVNSCIRKMDRIGMSKSRNSYAARPREGWRLAVIKFRKAVSMEIAIANEMNMQYCVGDL